MQVPCRRGLSLNSIITLGAFTKNEKRKGSRVVHRHLRMGELMIWTKRCVSVSVSRFLLLTFEDLTAEVFSTPVNCAREQNRRTQKADTRATPTVARERKRTASLRCAYCRYVRKMLPADTRHLRHRLFGIKFQLSVVRGANSACRMSNAREVRFGVCVIVQRRRCLVVEFKSARKDELTKLPESGSFSQSNPSGCIRRWREAAEAVRR